MEIILNFLLGLIAESQSPAKIEEQIPGKWTKPEPTIEEYNG